MKNQIIDDNDLKNVSREEMIEMLDTATTEIRYWRKMFLEKMKITDCQVCMSFGCIPTADLVLRTPEEALIDCLTYALESR